MAGRAFGTRGVFSRSSLGYGMPGGVPVRPLEVSRPMPESVPQAPFGHYRLGGLNATLLHLAQRAPANWLGRRAALTLRKVVMRTAPSPIDARVEGLKLRFHPRDNVGERKFLFMPRFFDPAERALIDRELPADGVFVDIGANVGIYTLWAARRLGEGGRVLALEPNPAAFERLAVNISLNGCESRVAALAEGVAEREGSFELHLDPANLGGSSLVATSGGSTIRVPCRPLLDILTTQGVRRVDILKIDVEGAEEQVLPPFFDTAPAVLRPRYIILEDSRDRWGSDLIGRLLGYGYRIHAHRRMNYILVRDDQTRSAVA